MSAGRALRLPLALCAGLLAAGVSAQSLAPERSLVPQPRPGAQAPGTVVAPGPDGLMRVRISASQFAPDRSPRPVPRGGAAPALPPVVAAPPIAPRVTPPLGTPAPSDTPDILARLLDQTEIVGGMGPVTELAVPRSLRPVVRPEGLEGRVRETAARTTPARVTERGQAGALCGDARLVGERLSPITGRISGCGIAQPVRLRAVDGVALSSPATINCDTARALRTWLDEGVRPAVGRRGGGVAGLRVVASYACRTRNSQPGARLSEHATGNAIDIAGIELADGTEISVLDGWRARRERRILEQMHAAACGTFGTVLGPESDRFHQDHFHLDVASYRSGAYCR